MCWERLYIKGTSTSQIVLQQPFRFFLSFYPLKSKMSLSNHKNPWLRNWVPQTSPPPYSGRNKTEHNIYISQAFNNISAVGANVQADEISSPRDVEETNLKPHSWLKSRHSFVRKYSKKVHLLWNWSRKLGPFQSSSQMALWSVAADFFINIGKFPNLWIRGDPRCNWTSSFAYRRIQAFIHLAICIDHLLGLCHARHQVLQAQRCTIPCWQESLCFQ